MAITYTVQILNLDFQVIREIKNLDKDTAEAKAEYAFNSGYAARVIDSSGSIICEFEV